MKSDWAPCFLAEIVDIHTDKVSVDDVKLGDYISTDSMLPDFGGITSAVKMPLSGKVTSFHKGDVLFSNIRTYFKKLWLANKSGACSNDVIVFRPKEGIESHYVFHFLMNENFIKYTIKTSKGTKMPRGDKDAILKYEFPLAPRKQRKLIGDYLISFKNRILLNQQTNQTLEQMAQALFKSWFVDFDPVIDNALDAGTTVNDFPETLQHRALLRKDSRKQAELLNEYKPLPDDIRALFPSEFEQIDEPLIGIKGWIPKGWKVSELGEFIKFANGKAKKFTSDGSYPIYGANGIIGNTDEVRFKNAVIVGRVGAYCGAIEYCREGFWSSDNTIVATSKLSEEQIPHILYLLKHLNLNQYAGGAAQPLLNQTTLNKLKVPLAGIDCLNQFNITIDTLLQKQIKNTEQTEKLSEIRNTLLPKLISGELQIPDEKATNKEVV